MIRKATAADHEVIAKNLWNSWSELQGRQIPTAIRAYPEPESLAAEILANRDNWLVYESHSPEEGGFFSAFPVGADPTYRRRRFPERAVSVDHFASQLAGEVLLQQFKSLAAHLPDVSLLLRFSSTLRQPYWAAMKAGFRLLGESPLIVGTFVWLYLDRDQRFDEIQLKLRRAKLVVEPS